MDRKNYLVMYVILPFSARLILNLLSRALMHKTFTLEKTPVNSQNSSKNNFCIDKKKKNPRVAIHSFSKVKKFIFNRAQEYIKHQAENW